jgi:hypothetical protein
MITQLPSGYLFTLVRQGSLRPEQVSSSGEQGLVLDRGMDTGREACAASHVPVEI